MAENRIIRVISPQDYEKANIVLELTAQQGRKGVTKKIAANPCYEESYDNLNITCEYWVQADEGGTEWNYSITDYDSGQTWKGTHSTLTYARQQAAHIILNRYSEDVQDSVDELLDGVCIPAEELDMAEEAEEISTNFTTYAELKKAVLRIIKSNAHDTYPIYSAVKRIIDTIDLPVTLRNEWLWTVVSRKLSSILNTVDHQEWKRWAAAYISGAERGCFAAHNAESIMHVFCTSKVPNAIYCACYIARMVNGAAWAASESATSDGGRRHWASWRALDEVARAVNNEDEENAERQQQLDILIGLIESAEAAESKAE